MSGTNGSDPRGLVDYTVELPSGGVLHLQTPNEVDLWNTALERYREDYVLVKHNDLVTLGALLMQQVVLYRCQTAINGMMPELDAQEKPTGSYKRVKLDASDVAMYQKTLTASAQELRALEKQLGIDKATREQGGAHTLDNYVRLLKRAAHERGIHITTQVLEYQKVFKELGWKIRMLYHADVGDRAYHGITPKSVLDWTRDEIARLEQLDKDFARETGKLYVGKL